MIAFLVQAVFISLSGVIAPGPMTAATLAAGSRRRHAGAVIALGHAVVEVPLMVLVAAGIGQFLESDGVRAGIGLIGGTVLVLMGMQLLLAQGKSDDPSDGQNSTRPFLTGIVLTGANPYFLFWWITIGLALITESLEWGLGTFVAFAIIHWLCDLVWLELLSLAAFAGSDLLGGRRLRIVLGVCGLMLVVFGGKFLYVAASYWLHATA